MKSFRFLSYTALVFRLCSNRSSAVEIVHDDSIPQVKVDAMKLHEAGGNNDPKNLKE